jgi:dienelactone hydrolase
MGFCIGGPFIWNLLQRAPERGVAAVLAQPSGVRPEMPDLSYNNNITSWAPALCARWPDITMEMVDAFLAAGTSSAALRQSWRDTFRRAKNSSSTPSS